MPGAILAGISGAGKTHLHRRCTNAVTASGREIILALPQAMTTTAHLHLGADPAAQARAVLEWCWEVVRFAERLHSHAQTGGLMTEAENYPFNWTPMLLLEGFIFDIAIHNFQISREDLLPIEQKLADLGVILVLLLVPDEKILEQSVRSTRHHRPLGWTKHLHALGRDDRERADHFRERQRLLLEHADTTPIPTIRIWTDDKNWDDYTDLIMEQIAHRARAFCN